MFNKKLKIEINELISKERRQIIQDIIDNWLFSISEEIKGLSAELNKIKGHLKISDGHNEEKIRNLEKYLKIKYQKKCTKEIESKYIKD